MPAIVVQCDNCGKELAVQTKFAGLARAHAAKEGWHPAREDGPWTYSYNYADRDLCPACANQPKDQPWPQTQKPRSDTNGQRPS